MEGVGALDIRYIRVISEGGEVIAPGAPLPPGSGYASHIYNILTHLGLKKSHDIFAEARRELDEASTTLYRSLTREREPFRPKEIVSTLPEPSCVLDALDTALVVVRLSGEVLDLAFDHVSGHIAGGGSTRQLFL